MFPLEEERSPEQGLPEKRSLEKGSLEKLPQPDILREVRE